LRQRAVEEVDVIGRNDSFKVAPLPGISSTQMRPPKCTHQVFRNGETKSRTRDRFALTPEGFEDQLAIRFGDAFRPVRVTKVN